MVHIGHVFHHQHKRKRRKKRRLMNKSKKDLIKLIDRIVYIVGAVSLLMTIPQILKIWIEQNPSGVSLLTWTTYLLGAIVWLFYGIVHKAKPIIFIYSFAILLDILIVIGIILYS